jgi:predicted transcriptional regulator
LELAAEDEAALEASFAEEARGAFATDEEIRAIWAKRGR